MRALRPMTSEEREFAEQRHGLVIDFLRCKRLPMEEFYDVVIFGYLSAVQKYFRDPPAGVEFRAMAFRAMKDAVLWDGEYHARAKRFGNNLYLAEYNGVRCMAIFNFFTGAYYVDDVYGVQEGTHA